MHCHMPVAAVIAATLTVGATADTVSLNPVKDNTLYESLTGDLSNGAGPHIYAGQTFSSAFRRAVLEFDVASAVPPGSTVDSATLVLHLSSGPPLTPDRTIRVHRVLTEWGEGTSDAGSPGGGGAAATTDDATWVHTYYNTAAWTAPGGDYEGTPSTQLSVPWTGTYQTWPSTSRTVDDVQLWLDSPADNHGWMLIGVETELQTARRFDSRDNLNPDVRPVLEIDFTPPGSCPADTDGSGVIDVTDLVNVVLDWATDGSGYNGDVNGDMFVDVSDLVDVILAWGPC